MSLFFLLLLSFRLMYVGDWHLEKGGDDAASASGSVQRRKILRADDSWGTIRRDVTNQYWWVVHRFVMSITVQIYERVTWWLTGQRPSLSLSLFFLMGGSRIFACCDCPCTPESGRIAFAGPDIHLWRQKAFQYYYISVPMEILCRGLPPKFSFRLIIGSTPFCFLFGF